MIRLFNNIMNQVHNLCVKRGHWNGNRDAYVVYATLHNKVSSAFTVSDFKEALEEEALADIIIQILDYGGRKHYNLGKAVNDKIKALRRKQ
jgi:hypothetical protein